MENSAYALKIAGAILIALLLIVVLVLGLKIIQGVTESQEKGKKQQEIVDFNLQYEAYNRDDLYGTDVVSVINKALDNNIRYENQTGYQIKITWIYDKPSKYSRVGKQFDTDGIVENYPSKKGIMIDDILDIGGNRINISVYRSMKFKCTGIEYENNGGRVSSMTFTYAE